MCVCVCFWGGAAVCVCVCLGGGAEERGRSAHAGAEEGGSSSCAHICTSSTIVDPVLKAGLTCCQSCLINPLVSPAPCATPEATRTRTLEQQPAQTPKPWDKQHPTHLKRGGIILRLLEQALQKTLPHSLQWWRSRVSALKGWWQPQQEGA